MVDRSSHERNRRWWGLVFLSLTIASAFYSFSAVESEVRKKYALDSPIAGTVDGKYRIEGSAYRLDGSNDILQSRLNSSNVVFYFLEQKILIDGQWIQQPAITDSVPYFLRDASGDIRVQRGRIVNAFSREIERMNVRQREAMLMVAEPALAIGNIHIEPDGSRIFEGDITPSRFYNNRANAFFLLANYSVYINAFFFLVILAADYRSSRYGRGVQTVTCLLTTCILVFGFEICLYRVGNQHLLTEYRQIENNLISAEDNMDRGAWILGIDAYNDHTQEIRRQAGRFPANVSVQLFGLKLPEIIAR